MKPTLIAVFLFFTCNLSAQNFTTTSSFVNYIEGDWEKVDTPNIEDRNSSKFLRFRFEKIVGDSLNLKVSVKSNTANPLHYLNYNCQEKEVQLDSDSTFYYAYLNLSSVNQNLRFRIDSINQNQIALRLKANSWTNYIGPFILKRVSSNDTLITGYTCDSIGAVPSKVGFGCNDSLWRTNDYGELYLHERSTVDSSQVGVFLGRYVQTGSCDSIVVLTVNILDSTTLFLTQFLRGKWQWEYTWSGNSAPAYADSFHFPIFWNVAENDSMYFFPYTLYVGDTLYACSSLYLLSDSRVENSQWSLPLLDGWRYQVEVIDSATVALIQLFVDDGPTHVFQKVSDSTIEYISISTCDLDDIGIDSILGEYCDTNVIRIVETYYDCPNAIRDHTEQILEVAPNPSNQTISFITNESISEVEVLNLKAQNLDVNYYRASNFLDISQLENGLYFLKLTSGFNTFYSKFIKN